MRGERDREERRERKLERTFNRFTARRTPTVSLNRVARSNHGVTLFVDNIGNNMTKDWLDDIFRFKSGRGLIGVYISFKPRKRFSKFFGFVRYKSKEEARAALDKVDGLFVSGSNLRVSYAKYATGKDRGQGKESDKGRQTVGRNNAPTWIVPQDKKGLFDGRSFMDVVRKRNPRHKASMTYPNPEIRNQGNEQPFKTTEENQMKIVAIPDEERLEWLRRSILGFTKAPVDLHKFSEILHSNHFRFNKVQAWGSHKFILTLKSSADKEHAMKLIAELGGNLIRGVREWREEDTSDAGEGIWFSCTGVPLHCWSKGNFEMIGQCWGEVLDIELEELLDRAWLLIDVTTKWRSKNNT